MSYKELADRLDRSTRHDAYMHAVIAKAIAILRSLDAQPVAEVMVMGSYRGKPILGCVLHSDSAKVGDKLYAAPVAAQPTFEKGSWQHAVDDQLVGFGRTSQEFGSPHDAVRWLIEQEVQAAQPTREQAQRERMEARQWNAKAFNFPEYFAALQRAMQARNATPADVSRATGVSATTLTRMKEGRRPDAASLAALSAWAGLNPAAYVKASPATADFDLPAQSDEVAAQPQQANWQAIQEAQQRYLPLIKAAVDLIAQCHEQLEKSPAPQCYGVPYGHLNALRDALLHPSVKEMAAQPQQATSLSDAEILDLAIPFGAFEYGDSQGHKRLAFTRAAITAFCQKNGIKEQG